MTDSFEPLHQPPSPRDLRESPPESSACARVRGLVRDFADADLVPEAKAEVEAHVHGCRTCGVALSRSEFEVLRLRRAFGENWAPATPRAGFARRAVARLLLESPELALEAAAEAERAEAAAANEPTMRPRQDAPRVDLARKVMARTTAELIADDRRARRGHSRLLVAACLASVVLVAALGVFWQSVVDLSSSARMGIVSSDQLWCTGPGGHYRLSRGDTLGEGAVLVLDEEGSADVEWYDASIVGEQPAAQIRMRGGGELRVEQELQLLRGSMEVESKRAMSVLLADGSSVELGAGTYHISVTEQMSPFDSLLPAAGRYGVRVDTLAGEAAHLLRDEGLAAVISAGQSGRYNRGLSGISVENLPPSIAGGAASMGLVRLPAEQPDAPDLRGTVLDGFGAPVAEAQVQLLYPTDGGMAQRHVATDAAGVYVLEAGSGIRAGYALLSVSPPVGRSDLSFLPLDARSLQPVEGGGFQVATATLGHSSLLRGRLVGSSSDRQYARVLPCFYDEVLGQVWPWFDGASTSDRDGRFSLVGLPSRLLAHQTAGLLVYQPNADVVFEPIPLPGSPAANAGELRISLLPLRDMALRGLPPGRTSVVLEEVVNLPAGSALRRHLVAADNEGNAAGLRFGRGRLWLEVAGSSPQSVRPIGSLGPGLAEVAGELMPRASVLGPTVPVPQIAGNALEIAVQSRFAGASLEPLQGEELVIQGVQGPLAADTQIYALAPRLGGGYRSRFLGLSRQSTGLRVAFEPGETEVLALGADGLASARANVSLLRQGLVAGRLAPLRLLATGTAQLDSQLVPHHAHTLGTVWQPVDVGHAGARPAAYRILAQNDAWRARDIPAGDYQVIDDNGRSFHVRVLPGEQVEIR